ncbi:hypothetical protein BRC81_10540 [Halobacteriales archaeon QS_1_68_20]|nr:MAG: hypothetical protein BRC81_10540 [Halobacteriales archaeon QS_1_68_20]
MAHRLARRANRAYHRRLGRRTHDPSGVDVVDADWGVLVVLDACRYDSLAARADSLPGDLKRRRSRGSHTVEFLWGNFANRRLHDTVYVTANVQPYVFREALDLHDVEHVWVDGFDHDAGTVHAETTTDAALAAAERFPRKRIVVHYLQPHYPFPDAPNFEYGTMAFWDAVAAGEVDATAEQLREWYEANLDRALPEVRRLVDGLDGRVVVTSDHGNLFGERVGPVPVREWGHPLGVYADSLVTVPWLVREGSDRRDVVAEDPAGETVYDEELARERLRALGYA